MAEQSFQSHGKWVPAYHFFVLPALLINLGFSIYWCVKAWFTVSGVLSVVVAAALFAGSPRDAVCAELESVRVPRTDAAPPVGWKAIPSA